MSSCHHVTLARSATAHVQQCAGCGCVSVHIGPTTLRVDAGTLEALWVVLGDAAAALHAERAGQVTHVRGLA